MKQWIAGLSIAAVSVFGIACDPEPDTAGEAVEEAGEDLGDAMDDAADEIKDATN